MAAPSYTSDLSSKTVTLCADNTGWSELTGHTSGGADATETDFYLQGSACVSQSTGAATGTTAGMEYDYGSNITLAAGEVFFVWQIFLAPNAIADYANGGMRFGVGSSTGNIKFWKTFGNDTHRYPYGGWVNSAVDPAQTADYTEGTPAGTYRIFGSWMNMLASVSKGNPHGVDAIRYGRGQLLITGGDGTNGYGTVAGMASINDDSTNRWGLMQYQAGSYLWKGLWQLGSSGAAVDFRDSNRSVVVEDTRKVYAAFNKIEVYNASSRVDWTAINITALGTVSKGSFEAVDDADINLDSCTFTDLSTFIFKSNSTILNSIFRRCAQITLGGATMTGCLITNNTAAIALACGSSVTGLSNTDFISSGTGHAIEITSGTSHTLNGITFTGYAGSNGSSGNEAVYVNISSGDVTIYADSTFSYRTAGANVTIIAGAVTATLKSIATNGSPIQGAQVFMEAANDTGNLPYRESVTIANSGTTATVTHTAHGMLTGDKVHILGASLYQNNGVFTITKISDNSYSYTMASAPGSNPTGTITATWTALYGTTDANGNISVTRVFSADQPVSGWARKSSSGPFYKTGLVTGIIDSGADSSFSALLILDQ